MTAPKVHMASPRWWGIGHNQSFNEKKQGRLLPAPPMLHRPVSAAAHEDILISVGVALHQVAGQ